MNNNENKQTTSAAYPHLEVGKQYICVGEEFPVTLLAIEPGYQGKPRAVIRIWNPADGRSAAIHTRPEYLTEIEDEQTN